MMKKLLLADDSITIQKVVGIIFSTEEYQLEMTDDGDSAFKKALEEIPDLVVADISMPGKDGFELCRAIKNEPSLAKTSVLLLPGAFDHFDEIKAGEVCADGWLTKPFESQALLDKVSQLLEAEPVRMAGMDAVVAEEETEQTDIEPVGSDGNLSVDETVLGLDAIDEVVAPTDEADEESPDDIWDAVSFAEEDLQDQSQSTSVDTEAEVSFAADVMDPSATDDVDIVTTEPEPEPEPEEQPVGEDFEQSYLEDSQSGASIGVDTTEVDENIDLDTQVEPVVETLPSEGLGDDTVDFSVFSESEDGFQQPAEDEDADTPIAETVDFATEEKEETADLEGGDLAEKEAISSAIEEEPVSAPLAAEPDAEKAVESNQEDVEPFELLEGSVEQDLESFEVEDEAASFANEPDDEDVIMELREEDELAADDSGESFIVEGGDDTSGDEEILDLLDDEVIESEIFEAEAVVTDNVESFDVEAPESEEEVFVLPDESDESADEIEPIAEVAEAPESEEEVFVLSDESDEFADEIEPITEVAETPESEDEMFVLSDEGDEDTGEIEPVTEVAEDESFFFDENATEEVDAVAVTAGVAAVTEGSASEQVEQQLRALSEDELKDVIAKVAGPMIEKMASEMLERIAWEVVPDLAEAMISEEIRKIKEGE